MFFIIIIFIIKAMTVKVKKINSNNFQKHLVISLIILFKYEENMALQCTCTGCYRISFWTRNNW